MFETVKTVKSMTMTIPSRLPKIYLIDAKMTLSKDWAEYTRVPTPPSNYKDFEKIQKWQDAKRETLEEDLLAVTSTLLDIKKVRILKCVYEDCLNNVPVNPLYSLIEDIHTDNVLIIGNKGKDVLSWLARNWYSFPMFTEECGKYKSGSDLFLGVNFGNVRFVTLEEFLYNTKERNMILTEKCIDAEREDYRDNINYMRSALTEVCFHPGWFRGMTYDLVNNKKYGN